MVEDFLSQKFICGEFVVISSGAIIFNHEF